MDIKRPRRILVLGRPDSGVLQLLSDLTGSAPAAVDNSSAGLSHIWTVKTNYYQADLPIWIDEIADLDAWMEEFCKPEAREVITSLGAWVYCFRRPVTQDDFNHVESSLKGIQTVIEKAAGYTWDGTCLAVATPQSTTPYLEKSVDEWDDMCREHGFEYIDSEAKGKNEFGEPLGIERIKEAIETTDWTAEDEFDGEIGGFDDGEEEESYLASFDAEEAEMSMEFLGLKTAMANGDDTETNNDEQELQVEEMERMMAKLKAIKDTGSAMPPEEKKRFTARAVNDILKSL